MILSSIYNSKKWGSSIWRLCIICLQISWTHALRKIVINCYKFHGREDLLPAFSEEDEKANQLATLNSTVQSTHVRHINRNRYFSFQLLLLIHFIHSCVDTYKNLSMNKIEKMNIYSK